MSFADNLRRLESLWIRSESPLLRILTTEQDLEEWEKELKAIFGDTPVCLKLQTSLRQSIECLREAKDLVKQARSDMEDYLEKNS
jgi:hypothetical protein